MNVTTEDVKRLIAESVDEMSKKYRWYDVNNAAYYAQCSRTTIFRAIRNGDLKAVTPKGMRSKRIRQDWLDRSMNNKDRK